MIYFDNGATSFFKPQIVQRAFFDSINYTANAGRSGHKSAIKASMLVNRARERLARFFDAEPSRVIFTQNCTLALNMVILGSVEKGCHVITTAMEHNSVLRPLSRLQELGEIELDIVEMNENGNITKDDIISYIKPNTKLVVVTATSNVTGASNDIKDMADFCHSKGIKIIVDGAQACGHKKISVANDGMDILCFAGHKGLYAMTGIGGMVVNNGVHLRPIILGGTGVDSQSPSQEEMFPDNFESGTLSTSLIASLGAGVEYVEKNFDFINSKIATLTNYAFARLKTIPNIKIYSRENNCFGVITFNLDNCDCNEVANYLDKEYDIAVRSGLHCAPLIHKQLGTLERGGAIRVSFSHKNSPDEIDVLVNALRNYVSRKDF